MHYRWKVDEGFLVGRSCSHSWQRINEVPKRTLVRWQAHRKSKVYLPLRDVLEMAQLHDRQLDSVELGKAVVNLWKLPEWGIPSRPLWPGQAEPVRPVARFLAALPDPLLQAGEEGSLLVRDIPHGIMQMLNFPGSAGEGDYSGEAAMGIEYVPPGKYYWSPLFEYGKETPHYDLIVGDTEESVQREIHRRYPDRPEDEVTLSDGFLALLFRTQNRVHELGDKRFAMGHRQP